MSTYSLSTSIWQILLCPRLCDENLVEQLSMYLAVADASGLPVGWSRLAHFSFTLVNQLDGKKSITKSTKGTVLFNENQSELGFKSFVPASELYDWTAGYLVSNKCIIKAKVATPIVKIQDPGTDISSKKESNRKASSNVNSGQAQVFSALPKTISSEQMAALQDTPASEPFCTQAATPTIIIEDPGTEISSKKECNREEPSNVKSGQAQVFSAAAKTISSEQVADFQDTTASEPFCTKATNDHTAGPSVVDKLGGVFATPSLIEFRGLGLIDKHIVPLLEEVCSWHPSLIECQKNRTRTFSECAFKSLGKLLHILKTTKVKDMTEDKFADIQKLWEELDVFGFDLAWLKPYVQSVLDRKKFIEMSGKVIRLREHVDELEVELKRQRTALISAEVDLEIKRRDLAETDELDLRKSLGFRHVYPL
ncbi:uncharacterized protein LOC133744383 [Rosa rugosa]|uniref:uncharacterized protein LOC133744383 n=1 Tax=Rosa rugosa TaxID=74645 RepID=UPI002B414845|nr:uncharacterized protein LOC133744383 [Rosa rugosa]